MSEKYPNKWLHRPLVRLAAALCLAAATPAASAAAGLLDSFGGIRETTSYRATYDDTLLDVARRFDLGYVEIVAANPGTDPWIPGEGTNVVLPTVHLPPEAEPEGIVVNLADMRLYYFPGAGQPMESFPIGIGRDGLTTPLGSTTVVRKTKDPVWRPTPRMRAEKPELPQAVPPGPDNPLGNRAMYLGWPQYLIHGTNKPLGIGRRTSSGCVRMYPEDVEYLYDRVKIGTKVTVVDQPIKLRWIDGALYIEAHPTQAQSDQIEATGTFDPILDSKVVDQVLAAAGPNASMLDWSLIRQATLERRGYPIRITR
ncbi:MAG TPA: L,D-transpeptidase family protein [Geminicoccaceae bacterium]|nr:L,D-transpeptidase family protein [Geminicoccaceae bacterium]